jgi:peptide/nickel transport system permease protein
MHRGRPVRRRGALRPGAAAAAEVGDREVAQQLRLDDPLPVRYARWAADASHGDFGRSLEQNSEPISAKLRRTIPNTVQLLLLAEIFSILVAIPIGVYSGYRANGKFDKVATGASFLMLAVPSFVMGIFLIAIFAVSTHLLKIQFQPISEVGVVESLKTSIMPVICISVGIIAVYVRLLRTDMISTLQEDYILAAKAKGMPTRHILVREALRPSSFSLITLAGVSLGRLIGGTVIVEGVFALPGVGRTVIDAATKSDYKLVQGGVLIIAVIYIALNLLVDIMYTYLDPRIRRGRV